MHLLLEGQADWQGSSLAYKRHSSDKLLHNYQFRKQKWLNSQLALQRTAALYQT